MARRREPLSLASSACLGGGAAALGARGGQRRRVGAAQGGGSLKLSGSATSTRRSTSAAHRARRSSCSSSSSAGTVRVMRTGKLLKQAVPRHPRPGPLRRRAGPALDRLRPQATRKNRRFYVYYADNDGNIEVDGFAPQARHQDAGRGRLAPQRDRRSRTRSSPITTAASCSSGPTATCTWAPATAAAAGPRRQRPEHPAAARQAAADRPAQQGRPLRRPSDNPYAAGGGATRSTRSACATRSGSRSTARPAICDRRRRPGQFRGGRPHDPRRRAQRQLRLGPDSRATTGSRAARATAPDRYRPPVLEYSHEGGNCAVTGGYVVRDSSLPALSGPLRLRRLLRRSAALDSPAPRPRLHRRAGRARRRSPELVRRGHRGHIYVTSLQGPVFRIVQK